MQWFRKTKAPEELYDCVNDPHELHNLVNDSKYADKLKELQKEMDRWITEIGDQPNLPEKELLAQLWKGGETQPLTATPNMNQQGAILTLGCATEGASIGYKVIAANGEVPEAWSVYTAPVTIPEGASVMAKAHRIGFLPSQVVEVR